MLRSHFGYIHWICILLLCYSLPSTAGHDDLVAKNGVLDLRAWQVDQQPELPLSGDWLFYPQQLLDLVLLPSIPIPETTIFPQGLLNCSQLPSTLPNLSLTGVHLRKQVDTEKTTLSNIDCYVTYVLEVRNLPNQPLAVFIPEMNTSFRLYWNSWLIAKGGDLSLDTSLYKPYTGHQWALLPSNHKQGVLILQVANFEGFPPAPIRPMLIGEANHIQQSFARSELQQALTAAIAAIAAILLILQQVARRRYEKGLWSLGVFSLAVMFYTLTEGYTVFNWFLEAPQWEWVVRLNFYALCLFVPTIGLWLEKTFAGTIPLRLKQWFILQFILPLAIFLLPVSVLSKIETPLMLFNLALGIITASFFIYFSRKKALKTGPLIFSLLVFLIAATHDVLLYQQIVSGDDWLYLGFVIFIVSQIFITAVQRARQHADIEQLNHRLQVSQDRLSLRVDMRTRKLQQKVDELEKLNNELQQLARYDRLTGLLRHTVFLEHCQQQVAAIVLNSRPVSVIQLDIDRFKQISAQFGHVASDQVMKDVAQLLQQWAQHDGRLSCRMEGESFALFALDLSHNDALKEAEWLRIRIAQRAVVLHNRLDAGDVFHVTASFGLSSCQADEANIHKLLSEADIALNRAKAWGRNCVVSYAQVLERQQDIDYSLD
ncbi:diguanylate cyclase (GGDEF) domain-containing protein [Oceanospirillum multiglobuliferum]|uniref:diguanylate cyclase n=1 Tax=Oceanospirillum multiglobuliferum TaxID=64969 RepID=A0A1T4MRL9_9GAMM|nr:diguanylate cyclase [Oceanospirillum multiglobuliferum]OPX56920.1 hypothetical protein BTE48_00335 [Oceanospirillum multiglobuliferum]SJZ69652.1 diguanylate cyclase (GGDEF) domain-containing protein [Oceanospirillum multiglobuliferum]